MPLAWVEEAVPETLVLDMKHIQQARDRLREPRFPTCQACNGNGSRLEVDPGDWTVRRPELCFHCGGTGLGVELGVSG